MSQRLFKLLLISSLAVISSCSTLPTGPERLELVDQLMAEHEYAKAENLLVDIAEDDPLYQDLLKRRQSLQSLTQEYEQEIVAQISTLKASDDWPTAEALLESALKKLPGSSELQVAEAQFYSDRLTRLQEIDRELTLLRGQHLTAKTPLVEQAQAVHPRGLKTRWQAFRHGREAEGLAQELLACGEHALAEARFDLAESCLKMATDLSTEEGFAGKVAELRERGKREKAEALARAEAERKAEQAAREARQVEQVSELKTRYRRLLDAGWLVAAREILSELQEQVPRDPEVEAWTEDLNAVINEHVAIGIKEGQALYSQGQLHEALDTWRQAARLDPQNPVLQAHISRVERFIAKLERLDKDDV